jgi:small conductance mechanosensitive channel
METNVVQETVGGLDVQGMFSSTPEWIATAQELLTKFGLKFIAAILIFVIGRWVAKQLKMLLQKTLERAKVDHALVGFACSLVHAGLMIFVVLAALGQIGVQTTSFIAVLGAAGLAVGLALQGSLANFASGVLILLFRPFKVGDFVEGAGATGVIKQIHIFTTTMNTPDNKRVIIPNSKMMGDNIINYSAEGTRRLDLTAGISYGDDIPKAKQLLLDVINADERVLKDPAPFVGVSEMADSSINFAVRPWVNVPDYWPTFFALNEAIKLRLEAEGFTIPFPQRDVHVYNEK